MFYSTVGHHCKFNSVSMVWGTAYKQVPASWGGATFTCGRTALPSCWYLSGFLLSAIQLQITPKCQEIMWNSSIPPVEGFLCLLDLQIFSSLYVRSSYSTQPNLRYFTLHLRTRLLKPPLVLYSEKSVTGEQGLNSCHSPVNAPRCRQSLLDCFTLWQYGKSHFSPPILHVLTCKSQPEHWHL